LLGAFAYLETVIGHFKRHRPMRKILFILTFFPTVLFGQVATFWADTLRIDDENILEAEWKINGQTLHYGSKPIEVRIDKIIDTILFKQFKHSKWDTLICNIAEPLNYTFQYNMCCGGFDVYENDKRISGTVIFIIKNSDKKKKYLGQLDGAGILLDLHNGDTLKPICWSPMHPNIYNVALSEIEICKDTTNCNEEICLYENGNEEPNYGFGFKTISNKFNCLFLPLSGQPIKVIYDRKTDKIKIE
jgi:hypothetical protein